MPFCPHCKAVHDADLGCADGTGQFLREAGVGRTDRASSDELKRAERRVARVILVVILMTVALAVIMLVRQMS